MYASLGDIVFQLLTSFDALSDKRETRYAELVLTQGKPNLQLAGETLTEFQMSIGFHAAFCHPEEEFLKLNNARVRGEILPFMYGNGYHEGDYVITTLERVIHQTDERGNFIQITCHLTLKEYTAANTEARRLEQDKKNAFALSSNRPLPVRSRPEPDNPALKVALENQKNKYATAQIARLSDGLENDVNVIKRPDPAQELKDKAQKFVDAIGAYTRKLNVETGKANQALGSISSVLNAYSGIVHESPVLPARISAVQNSLYAISTQLTALETLPAIIGNVTDAQTALAAMVNTLNLIKTLKDNTKALNNANAAVAKALATRKPMT
jgi:phage protein U